MSRGRRASVGLFLIAALGCLGCDQLTKDFAREHLAGVAPSSLAFGTVQLALTQNAGGFMSLGAGLPESVREALFLIGVPILMSALCIVFLRQPRFSNFDALALALVVGGGTGNWLDRVLQGGSVTDFVRIGWGPLRTGIFNLADVAIVVGVIGLVISHWQTTQPMRPASEA